MESLTENEIKLFKNEFEKELVRLHESHDSPHSHWSRVIMPRQKIDQIIHHLKGIAPFPPGKMKSWIESRKFKVFNKPSLGLADVLMEPTKEKVVALGQTSESILPRYLRVVPREEIFDTLLKIHLKHNHSTLRETAHLVRSVISNIPRYLVHKFILLCPVCSNNGATSNSAGLPYTPSRRCMIKARRRRKLMDQFQVDVLDLKDNPDGSYHYILHCMDHITGFHWLFPLAAIDPAEVAQNLVWGIFSLFGFPSELVSDYGKEFASAVIEEVTRLWPDELHIKNYLEGSSYKGDVSRRNTRNVTRFIEHMAGQKAALGDSRLKWSEWLPEIQFLLNSTILDVRTGKTPYEKVFRMHPITPPPKTKLGPAPGEVPTKKSMPKRRRHHLKYTPEFLTEDVVDQAKVLTVDDQGPDESMVVTEGSPPQEVVVSGPNAMQFVHGSIKDFGTDPHHHYHHHHHTSTLVGETVDDMASLGVAQEVVTTSHEAVPASSAMSLSSSGNVVVVDIAGVEHTVENTVITDGYVTTGGSLVSLWSQ
ncbi:Ribonuclease H-like domain [Trinorchestia longiramus]|nr:Ribonuclease H-like domain [Trinorchestia longiramus]